MKKILKEEQLIELIENIISEISNKTKSQYIKKSLEKGDGLGKERVKNLFFNYLDKEIDHETAYEFFDPTNNIILATTAERSEFYIDNGDLVFDFYPLDDYKISKLGNDSTIRITLKDIHDYKPFLGNNQLEVNKEFAIIASRVINMLRGVEDNFSPYGKKQYKRNNNLKTFFKNLFNFKKPIKPSHFKLLGRNH